MVSIRNTPKLATLKAGQKFSRLTAVAFVRRNKEHRPVWKWLCDCGKEHEAVARDVTSGDSKSCGCYNRDMTVARNKATATHGMTNSPEFTSWRGMIDRCRNQNCKDFSRYGERGILVCERWNAFENFYEYMGRKPSSRHSIDRFPNNDGNYEPDNCRWATPTEQSRNRRNSKTVEFGGKQVLLTEVAEKCGISYFNLWQRLKYGWSVERATKTPIRTTIRSTFLRL